MFAATLVPARSGTAWPVAVFSSATGHLVRWLARPPGGASDLVLGVRGGWVYFAALRGGAPPGVWRVPLTGGPARLLRAGTPGYAQSPDGRMAAWVVTVNHGRTTAVVVSNRVTGHRRTIVVATRQPGEMTLPGVGSLAWAADDTHLAVEVVYAAFASDVIVVNARTAATIADGRKVPCPGGCAAKFPSYLRTGALAYVTEQLRATGPTAITLVRWAGGHRAKHLVTLWAGRAAPPIVSGESTTPQGAAIWVLQTGPPARYTIWRWSGSTPVRVKTFPARGYDGPANIAW